MARLYTGIVGCEIIEDMTADTAEAQRPTKNEVMGITTPETEEAAAVAEVERLLIKHNPNGLVARAKAITAATPIPQSPELDAVKAVRVGSQEPIINPADVSHNVDILTSRFTGKSIWARIGRAFRSLNILNKRMKDKAKAPQETDSSQMNVGQ